MTQHDSLREPKWQSVSALRRGSRQVLVALSVVALLSVAGCKDKTSSSTAAEAPPAATVVPTGQSGLVEVEKPELFTLVDANTQSLSSPLSVTGAVSPDVSKEIPIVSLANGRIVALHVGLGQTVTKGQLLMEVQSADVSTAFGSYLKAVNDERLTKVQLDRNTLLYSKGAIARSQVEIAQNAEEDAQTALTASEQQLHVLGVDPKHPGETVKVYSPASGVVIQQSVTAAAPEGVTYGAGQNPPLTVADLSHVWVICDVYENDLSSIKLGESAQIHLTAFPGKTLTGTISDIGAVLDPNIRTAKVRIQVPNPGMMMRIGMFATATFTGGAAHPQVVVPASAVLHLHDRDWVFIPVGNGATNASGHPTGDFRRVPVVAGQMVGTDQQVIVSGLSAGQKVVNNALKLENAAGQ